jgi:hypothetical protein
MQVNRFWLLLHDHWDFVSRLQLWKPARFYDYVTPFAGGRKSADLMGLINEFIQIEPEFFEGYGNNDLYVDPVVISGFFLDVGGYCEGSLHNLYPDRFRGLLLEFGFWG